jgi:ABC-type xylose transport system permease subunit
MPDPYELDDEGNAVAESDAPDSEEQEALRRQVDQTLRFMRLQTAVGFVVLLVLIIVLSDIRGVMVLVTIVFLLTSFVAYAFLSRTLHRRVLGR